MQPGTTSPRYIQAQCSDVQRTIEISIATPATYGIGTGKTFAVSLAHVQTGVAHLRGVGRRHKMQHNTGILRLVRHKRPQLVKRPTVAVAALTLAPGLLIGALTNTRQVFQSDGSLRLQRGRNQILADLMVGLALKTSFPPRQPCQKLPTSTSSASRAFRGFFLERSPQPAIAIAYRCQVLSTPVLIIAGVGNIGTSQINPQHIRGLSGYGRRAFGLNMQKERAIAALDQRGTGGHLSFEPSLLPLPQHGLKTFSTVQERQAKRPVPLSKAENALIVVNRRGLKRRMGFALDLQRRTHASDSPDGEIGGQAKLCTHVLITDMLERDLVGRVLTPCDVRNEVARSRKGTQRSIKFNTLLWGWRKLTGYRAYGVHVGYFITYGHHISTSAKASQAVPPLPLKRRGFHGAKAQENP